VTRLLKRLDDGRIRGTIKLVGSTLAPAPVVRAEISLGAGLGAALAGLPAAWSALYGEVTLTSTAFVPPASMLCTPINLRLEGDGAVLRFRSAKTFGYGASPGM